MGTAARNSQCPFFACTTKQAIVRRKCLCQSPKLKSKSHILRVLVIGSKETSHKRSAAPTIRWFFIIAPLPHLWYVGHFLTKTQRLSHPSSLTPPIFSRKGLISAWYVFSGLYSLCCWVNYWTKDVNWGEPHSTWVHSGGVCIMGGCKRFCYELLRNNLCTAPHAKCHLTDN